MSGILRTLLIVAVGLMAGALAVQNNQSLSLRFVVWESLVLPVWVFLLVALAIGVVLGGGSLLADYLRLRRQLSRERHRAEEATRRAETAEREVESLRGRATAVTSGFRDDIEIVEEDESDSTAMSKPGRGTGGYE